MGASEQQRIMAILEKINLEMMSYYDAYPFLPLFLLIVAIVTTYSWGVLNHRIKLLLAFAGGFLCFGPLLAFFIGLFFTTKISEGILLIACGLVGGLFCFCGYVLKELNVRIMRFLGVACIPLSFIPYYVLLMFFGVADDIRLIIAGIIISSAAYAAFKISQFKLWQIISSSIVGALCIAYLLLWSTGQTNFEKVEGVNEGIILLEKVQNVNQVVMIIIIAGTGILVQSALLSTIRRHKSRAAEKSKRKSEQVLVS